MNARTTTAQTPRSVVLVSKDAQPGSYPSSTKGSVTALPIGDGEILIANPEVNTYYGSAAAATASKIEIHQGTPISKNLQAYHPSNMYNMAVVKSNEFIKGNVASVAYRRYTIPNPCLQIIGLTGTVVADQEYSLVVRCSSRKIAAQFDRSEILVKASYTAVTGDTVSNVIKGLVKAMNIQVANRNVPFVALAVGASPSLAQNSYLATSPNQTIQTGMNLVFNRDIVQAYRKALLPSNFYQGSVALPASILTTGHGILSADGNGNASQIHILGTGLSNFVVEEGVKEFYQDLYVTIEATGLTKTTQKVGASNGVNMMEHLTTSYNERARLQISTMQTKENGSGFLIQPPSFIDTTKQYNELTIHHFGEQRTSHVNTKFTDFLTRILLPSTLMKETVAGNGVFTSATTWETTASGLAVRQVLATPVATAGSIGAYLNASLAPWLDSSNTYAPIDYSLDNIATPASVIVN